MSERVEDGWLVLEYADNPVIRLDGRVLDGVVAGDQHIDLLVDDKSFRLSVNGDIALALATELSGYNRLAPITSETECEAAKSRLAELRKGEIRTRFLYLGTHSIYASKGVIAGEPDNREVGVIVIGGEGRYVEQVAELADRGESLSLSVGRIQAAIALLVVAVRQHPESPEILTRRIEEFERLRK